MEFQREVAYKLTRLSVIAFALRLRANWRWRL